VHQPQERSTFAGEKQRKSKERVHCHSATCGVLGGLEFRFLERLVFGIDDGVGGLRRGSKRGRREVICFYGKWVGKNGGKGGKRNAGSTRTRRCEFY
jgi:hypothetical protein